MWKVVKKRKFIKDQRGSFTVEAAFIFTITIAVIMALLYVVLFYTDRIYVEARMRRKLVQGEKVEQFTGLLGEGSVEKKLEVDVFSTNYGLRYHIAGKFPLSEQYLDLDFYSFLANIKKCDKEPAELVRLYEALKSKE